jgi:transposase
MSGIIFPLPQVIFSDETYVDVSGPVSQYVRRSSSESIHQAHCTAHKPFLQRVMFWGAFHSGGPLPLIPLSGTMNAAKYIAILHDNLVPFLDDQPLIEQYLFQQDNAPAHRAASTMSYLRENCVDLLWWPPFSPDLNPIENLWGIMKRKLRKEGISNKHDLLQQTLEMWNSPLVKGLCKNLSDSMSDRIKKCLRNRGRYIPY